MKTKPQHRVFLQKAAGCIRLVWNKALAHQNERRQAGQRIESYENMAGYLVQWKQQPDLRFLCEAPSQALQSSLKNLDIAFRRWFNRDLEAEEPKFKKKFKSRASVHFPQGFQLDQNNNQIKLPKLGWIKYVNSRRVEGIPKNVTVSRDGDHWFVSIQVEWETKRPLHPHFPNDIGIDLGVNKFGAGSNGQFIAPVHAFRKTERRLAESQRKLSLKQKFSNNWRKAKAKVQAIHRHIKNIRHDFLHKAFDQDLPNHALICLEDLKIKNMSKSAQGTVENPGKNVAAKSGLNKSILDQAWGEFDRQCDYKSLWSGGLLFHTHPAYSSQKCSECGFTNAGNRPTQAEFRCLRCGHAEHADTNAGKNH